MFSRASVTRILGAAVVLSVVWSFETAANASIFDTYLEDDSEILTYQAFGFHGFTGYNRINDVVAAEQQLAFAVLQRRVDVPAADTEDPYHIRLAFFNRGPEAMSITAIYIDDGHIVAWAETSAITASAGVSFDQSASPGNLPGAENLVPNFGPATEGFFAPSDSNAPVSHNGIDNSNEYLELRFQLLLDGSGDQLGYGDVISDILNGRLRIGIHVQGFVSEGSESLVNSTNLPGVGSGVVPEPTALLVWSLLGGGAAAGASLRRRRTRWSPETRQSVYHLIDRGQA